MTLKTLSVFFLLVWILVGAVWLLPRKLRLMKRLGHMTADQVIQLGKAGDAEVRSLRKKSFWWFGVGLAVLMSMQLVFHVTKMGGS